MAPQNYINSVIFKKVQLTETSNSNSYKEYLQEKTWGKGTVLAFFDVFVGRIANNKSNETKYFY